MASILVLGSRGQLGLDLMRVLQDSHHQVIGLTSADFDAKSVDVLKVIDAYNHVDYVINCVAMTNVDGCEETPGAAFLINCAFVTELAKWCALHNKILVQISTDYVFAGDQLHAYNESDHARPLNSYGLSKYAAEIAIANYCHKYFILRVSSLFGIAGASGKGGNFITTMLRLAQEKDEWTVISDQITCPTHTLDIARAINALIDQQVTEYGIYHCVSNNSCSWFEFARKILEHAGYDPNKVKPISYRDYIFRAKRPQYGVLSTAKLSRYYQMPSFEAALIEYFLKSK